MKILLTTLNAKYIHLNLAIRLLYDLNKNNEGLQWKEFTIKEPKDEIADYCKAFDVVCFSCYIWNITQTLEVAKKIKVLNPATKKIEYWACRHLEPTNDCFWRMDQNFFSGKDIESRVPFLEEIPGSQILDDWEIILLGIHIVL